jgi:hypothetical protein
MMDQRRALDHLDQPHGREMRQEQAEQDGARHHAEQQRRAEQRHHLRPCMGGGEVGGERQPHGLGGVEPCADQEEGQSRREVADPERPGRVARQDQEGERHDRQAAELEQRAEPDVGHPPPAQDRAVRVRSEADDRPQGREDQRQRQHHRDDPGRDPELDDHHPVERSDQQDRGHADRDLEQGEAEQAPQRQLDGGGIREGQDRRAEAHQGGGEGAAGFHGTDPSVPSIPLILRCCVAASKEPSRDRAAGWSPPSRPPLRSGTSG